MEELLYELTPAEWWVWSYLLLLAQKQGSAHIILPRPGEDLQAEKVLTRRHLKRVLKSLKAKFRLTQLIIPRSKSKRIEVLLPAAKIGGLNVRNEQKDDISDPNKAALGAPMSAIKPLRTLKTPIKEVIQGTLPNYTPPQAKLKEKLETLLKLKQGDLKGGICNLDERDLWEMRSALQQLVRYVPKAKQLSEQARVYAVVRLLQAGESIARPQAWVDQVARIADREFKEGRWNGETVSKIGLHHG